MQTPLVGSAVSPGFAHDVRHGLSLKPKRLSSTYLYDQRGAQLFEEICTLPEYYLTRAEHEILSERSSEIARRFGTAVSLIELGSGSAVKTTLLIDALIAQHGQLRYFPIDVAHTMLAESSARLSASRPLLEVHPIPHDHHAGLERAHALAQERAKLILWLGSSIGNLDRAEAATFLQSVREKLSASDRLLVGIDLRKNAAVLESAYADAEGVTARFNLNLLERINRELQGGFQLGRFRHLARVDEDAGCVRMFLVSSVRHRVAIGALGLDVELDRDEAIHTESSYKYDFEEIRALARAAGFDVEEQWLDRRRQFSLNLLAPVHH